MPATRIDDKLKRDLRLLRLRSAMDPKRFYKSADGTKFPKHFQVGTVVAGPNEFYSGKTCQLGWCQMGLGGGHKLPTQHRVSKSPGCPVLMSRSDSCR